MWEYLVVSALAGGCVKIVETQAEVKGTPHAVLFPTAWQEGKESQSHGHVGKLWGGQVE
jgi:hypothetical protein